jgi:membrane protease YdiL (CAAX protease family)
VTGGEPPGVGVAGWAWLALVLAALPYLAWRTKLLLDEGADLGARRTLLAGVLLQQALLAAATLVVCELEDVAPALGAAPSEGGWWAALGVLALALASVPWRWSRTAAAERARLFAIGPESTRDLPLWFALSLAAGFAEELAWRGLLVELLARAGLAHAPALLAAALSFALAHLTQGWRSLVPVFLFALGLHAVVAAGGSLWPAMAAHGAYDAAAGLALLRLRARERRAG